jgi:tRNA dimethylallyltransferase
LPDAIAFGKRETRRLAKRQLTWFRRDPDVVWIDAEHGYERASALLEAFFAEPSAATII